MQILDKNKLYRLQEVAKITGIPKTSLATWARTGRIEATRLGKIWHMTSQQVEKLMHQGTVQEPSEPDALQDIDLSGLEIRITSVIERTTGKRIQDYDRDEILSILEDFARIIIEGRTKKPDLIPEEE